MELAGPLGIPLGLAQWKRASSRGQAGTSGFLSVSAQTLRPQGPCRVGSGELGLVLSEEGNSDCLSSCSGGSGSVSGVGPGLCPFEGEGLRVLSGQVCQLPVWRFLQRHAGRAVLDGSHHTA